MKLLLPDCQVFINNKFGKYEYLYYVSAKIILKKLIAYLFFIAYSFTLIAQTGLWYNNNETKTSGDVLIGTTNYTTKSKLNIYQSFNCDNDELDYLTHRLITLELSPNNVNDISINCPLNRFHIGLNKKELYYYSYYNFGSINKNVHFFIDTKKGTGINKRLYFGVNNRTDYITNEIDFSNVSKKKYVFYVEEPEWVVNNSIYFKNSLQLIPLNNSGQEISKKAIVFSKVFDEAGSGNLESFDLIVHGDITTTQEMHIGKIDDSYSKNFTFKVETDNFPLLANNSQKLTISRTGINPMDIISFRENGKVEIGDLDVNDQSVQVIISKNNNLATDYRLAVEGGILAKQVWITQLYWPDEVFIKGYKLMSLKMLKDFIENNKHLPGIPDKDEVKANGINLGDMNAKLLAKIEELTLYIINQEEQINSIKKDNNTLHISSLVLILFALSLIVLYRKNINLLQ